MKKYIFYILLTIFPFLVNAQSHLTIGKNIVFTVGSAVDVQAGTVNNQGDLELNGTATFKEVHNGQGSNIVVLNINDGAELIVEDNITNNKEFNVNPNGQLSVNTAVSTDNSISNQNGTFTIKSDASGTGSVITKGTVERLNSAVYKVERFFKTPDIGTGGQPISKWHLVSSPVDKEESGIFTGHFLNYYDHVNGDFKAYSSTKVKLNIGEGYVAKLDFDDTDGDGVADNPNPIVFTADKFNTGNVRPVLLIGGAGNTFFGLSGDFNLLGNPYPSNLDWETIYAINTNNVTQFLYYYVDDGHGTPADPDNPGVDEGKNGWQVYDGSGTTTNAERIISIGQGFGVVAKPAGSLLYLHDTDRTHESGKGFTKKNNQRSNFLKLVSSTNSLVDEAFIRFNENATNDFDYDYDAYKFNSFAHESPNTSFISADNKKMYICEMPATESVDLGFNMRTDGEVIFSVNNTDGFTEIILEDKDENTFTDLMKESYPFRYTVGDKKQGRFTLHFTRGALSEVERNLGMKIYFSSNTVYVKSSKNLIDATVNIYNINGQVVLQKQYSTLSDEEIKTDLARGVYIIEVNSNEGKTTTRINITNNNL